MKLVLVDGLSQLEAGRRLSLSNKTLGNWVRERHKAGKLTEIGKQQEASPRTDLEAELARVKRELAVVTMERDVLKKATVYFGEGVRGEIRPDRNDATQDYPVTLLCRGLRGRGERLLRLAQTAPHMRRRSKGERPAGSGDRRSPTNAPGRRMARSGCSRICLITVVQSRRSPDQADPQEAESSLQAETQVQEHPPIRNTICRSPRTCWNATSR